MLGASLLDESMLKGSVVMGPKPDKSPGYELTAGSGLGDVGNVVRADCVSEILGGELYFNTRAHESKNVVDLCVSWVK